MKESTKFLKELLDMLTKMPDWKFLLVWMIGAMFGAGYLIKAIAELIK